MRKLLWLGVVVLLLAGAAWWVYHSFDRMVASAIRRYGAEMTQVRVQLGAARVSPLNGRASLQQLELGNPPGFATPRALAVAQIRMQLDVASLTREVVHIHEVVIEQPDITYEYARGGSNLERIQRNVERYVAALASPADAGSAPQKKVVIDHFYIRGATAHVSAAILQGKSVAIALPDLHVKNIGTKAGGISPAQATHQVWSAMRSSVLRNTASLHLEDAGRRVKSGLEAVGDKIKGLFK